MDKRKFWQKSSIVLIVLIFILGISLVAFASQSKTATTTNVTASDIIAKVNVDYTINLTDRIANLWQKNLGFAVAGSKSSAVQGEYLINEMKKVGLTNVTKDQFPVDAWDYSKLILKVNSPEIRDIAIAPYAGSVGTNGKDLTTEIVYAGYGTKAELEKANVKGKIVLAEFDLLYDYWPSMVAQQAAKMGAKALIIMYSDTNITDPGALNSYDTQSLLNLPIANISKTDGEYIKGLLKNGEVNVTLNSDAKVTKNQKTYNVVGYIPGKDPSKYIIISGHRDAFFKAFSDDTLGIASVISIGKAMKEAGYKPEHTLVFVNFSGEEYGVAERRYDWLIGSWYSLNKNHPEWQENTIANFNIDNYLSNHLSTVYRMRSANALVPYLQDYVDKTGVPDKWTDGVDFLHPSTTYNDTYVMTTLGIPGIDMTKAAFNEN